VPQDSLDSFPPEFKERMAARADLLGDTGESAPERWERPLGTPDVHIALAAIATDATRLDVLLDEIRASHRDLAGVVEIWRQDCYALPTEREAFGFKDGISHPAIEGSGIPGSNPKEQPFKPGEFVLGYLNELGELPRCRARRSSAGMGLTSCSESSIRTWRRSAATCASRRRTGTTRSFWRQSSLAVGRSDVGQITSAEDGRILQLGIKYLF
jgi:hypothetical protein